MRASDGRNWQSTSVEVMYLKILSVNFTGEVLMNGRIGFTLYLKVLDAVHVANSFLKKYVSSFILQCVFSVFIMKP
jgi:hypothetical protein